jgi:uncharacterized membrane protein
MMNLRLALYELAWRHRLAGADLPALEAHAGLGREPEAVPHWAPRAVAGLAAALIGLGLAFWVAANWQALGRFGRFALLEAVVLAMCVGAFARPAARGPLGLLALLAIGGLFAYFGQTYQTGADPWQLFALWSLLALPLALAARSDLLWAPWALVATTAVALWVHAHTAHRWRVEPQDLQVHLMGWALALGLVLALGPVLRRWTGAGPWARRTAVTLMVVTVTATSLGALFFYREVAPQYALGLLLLVLAAVLLSLPRSFEVYGVSAVALGIDTLLVCGLARWLFDGHRGGDPIGPLFAIGLAAAGLLAGTVNLVLRLARLRSGDAGSEA